jgi:putative FmdB family regulatory protein
MPIYEFKCTNCNFRFEKLMKYKEYKVLCPICRCSVIKEVSVPGYRRDHTVLEITNK